MEGSRRRHTSCRFLLFHVTKFHKSSGKRKSHPPKQGSCTAGHSVPGALWVLCRAERGSVFPSVKSQICLSATAVSTHAQHLLKATPRFIGCKHYMCVFAGAGEEQVGGLQTSAAARKWACRKKLFLGRNKQSQCLTFTCNIFKWLGVKGHAAKRQKHLTTVNVCMCCANKDDPVPAYLWFPGDGNLMCAFNIYLNN